MLDPSSSEEESDEIVEEESGKEVLGSAASGARLSPSRTSEGSGGVSGAGLGGGGGAGAGAGVGAGGGGGSGASSGVGAGGLQPSSRAGGGRPSSPSPSVVSEKEKEELERLQKEEEERKKRLQLYVFVMRCIAYPFNAKQPTDMARRQQKVGAPGRPRELRRDVARRAGRTMGAGGAAGEEEQEEETAPWGRGCQAPPSRPGPAQLGARLELLGTGEGPGPQRRVSPPGSAGELGGQVPLYGPGGSGSDLQPAAPREALLVLPGSRHSPAAGGCAQLWARLPGRALGGRGHPAGGGTGVEREERLRAALGSPSRESRSGWRQKASPSREASSHTGKGTLLPASGSADPD